MEVYLCIGNVIQMYFKILDVGNDGNNFYLILASDVVEDMDDSNYASKCK